MTALLQDLRYALRLLRKNPGFTVTAVITLALAIGANTAIFSVVHTVLLAHLPYKDVDRLAMIWGLDSSRANGLSSISAGEFGDWKQQNDVFEDIAASFDNEMTLTGSEHPKLVLGYNFSPNYFRILGVSPKLGRTFTDDEDKSGAHVVVLSDSFWRTTLHGDPQILGKTITLDAKPFTVIGVMPPDFNYPPKTELWMPISIPAAIFRDYEHRYIHAIGRLKPGVSVTDARARMNTLERRIAGLHPEMGAESATLVEPLRQQLSGDIRTPLLALFGAVGVVLLIACVNIAGLLLARAASRQSELAIRVAIGASRARLFRQHLCESLLLALIGGAFGIVLARISTTFLLAIFPNKVANLSIPQVEAIHVNGPVLWFAFGITVFTAFIFGSIPALQSVSKSRSQALKTFGRGGRPELQDLRSRRILITTEISLSLVLLAGAGLMIESFQRARNENIGFNPDHVLALEVFPAPNEYANHSEKQSRFVSNVLDRLRTLPGTESVGATNYLPLTGFWGATDFSISGQPAQPGMSKPNADNRLATPGYFSTMQISLLEGRDFTDSDRAGTEPVAIVNSALARRYFGNTDPIGKIIEISGAEQLQRCVVVGVVSNIKAFGPEQPPHAEIYRPVAQTPLFLLAFVVRTTADPATLLRPAEQAIWSVDRNQPIFDAMPLNLLATQSITLRRTSTILIVSFAILALLLAAVGLYGGIAYTVAQRTPEIGIRMALGARRTDVLGLILGSALQLVLIGEIVGFVAALMLAHAASSLLFGIRPSDPRALAAVGMLLAVISLVASYLPARRAAKVDPMVALRYE
jgi:predicted permease